MSLWRQFFHGLRVLTQPKAADRDVSDEVQHFLDEATASGVASGLSPEESRRAAQVELGNTTLMQERVRAYGWENLVGTLLADLRYALRQLRSNPGFTAVAVLTLALGVGATTAIFSAVNPILFESLPYPQANRIMMIWDMFKGVRSDLAFNTYRELALRNRSFESMAVMKVWQPTMTGADQPERFDGQSVSAGYFTVLGVKPTIGRDFQPSDDQFKGAAVAIISYGLWQRRFAGDGLIVGRQIKLDDNLYTIIGVMPKEFDNVLAPAAELWSPLQYDDAHMADFNTREWGHHLHMIGRVRPGVGAEDARRDFSVIARTPVAEFPRPRWAAMSHGFIIDSLQHEVSRDIKPALLAILGAVFLVLTIACVNVTNLLLARGVQRRGEFAVRAALGAGRVRLVRQLLTESLVLAAMGSVVGMMVAMLGVRALVLLSPPGLPRVSAIVVNGAAFAFALGVTTVIGLVVGLVPALHASRRDVHGEMQQGSQRTAGGHQWARRILVVSEVALALVLLVSTGLLLRSLNRLFSIAPGFDASQVITMQVQTSGRKFNEQGIHRFFDQALDTVHKLPGVQAAGFTSLLPLSDDLYGVYGAEFEDGSVLAAFRYIVTPGYLETMGIQLRRGRLLDAGDVAGAPLVAVISESFAKSKFHGQDPIGQRFHLGPNQWYTIVGIVGDVKQSSLAASDGAAVYITTGQSWFADRALSLVARTHGNPAAVVPAIRKAIWSVDKDQPIVRIATMDSLLAATEADRHFALILFEAFAGLALLLAAIGIYGVLAGNVTERTREIGVRSALGATRGNIISLVVRQGMSLTGIGVLIGLVGAAVATKALITLLFGISRLDPVTYFGVVALLACVSVIACWAPAWRASRVDPSVALRAE
ncbi:MAG TPA: ABC transporter permease [Alphaproteobacteria bacterium]|nr:ABC transporter permease [Alphaproteobacteria bacterium]